MNAPDTTHENPLENEEVITTFRCENCGTMDPKDFSRTYVEERTEKLVKGRWTPVECWEYEDGSHTFVECDACGPGEVEEIT